MTATTDFVGVRVFSDLWNTVKSLNTRNSTVIGMRLPCPNILLADDHSYIDDSVTMAQGKAGLLSGALPIVTGSNA